jgi:hypothetical protein
MADDPLEDVPAITQTLLQLCEAVSCRTGRARAREREREDANARARRRVPPPTADE